MLYREKETTRDGKSWLHLERSWLGLTGAWQSRPTHLGYYDFIKIALELEPYDLMQWCEAMRGQYCEHGPAILDENGTPTGRYEPGILQVYIEEHTGKPALLGQAYVQQVMQEHGLSAQEVVAGNVLGGRAPANYRDLLKIQFVQQDFTHGSAMLVQSWLDKSLLKHGQQTYTRSDTGQLHAKYLFKHGILDGPFEEFREDGSKIVGTMRNGERLGGEVVSRAAKRQKRA